MDIRSEWPKKGPENEKNAPKELCDQVVKSYGATLNILHFLTSLEQLHLQLLCPWFYKVAVSRVQSRW